MRYRGSHFTLPSRTSRNPKCIPWKHRRFCWSLSEILSRRSLCSSCRKEDESAWSSTWERMTSSLRRAVWWWATANTTWCDSHAVVATPRYRWTTSQSLSASPQVGTPALMQTGRGGGLGDFYRLTTWLGWLTHWRERLKELWKTIPLAFYRLPTRFLSG